LWLQLNEPVSSLLQQQAESVFSFLFSTLPIDSLSHGGRLGTEQSILRGNNRNDFKLRDDNVDSTAWVNQLCAAKINQINHVAIDKQFLKQVRVLFQSS